MIFLELHKAYNALDRDRFVDILEGYGVGPRSCRILQTYWDQFRMVARAGGSYGTAFQGFRGVMQRDPLLLTILNLVVDAVVRHWVEVMVEIAGEQNGRGREGRHQNALFYVDDDMVA